MYPLELCIYIYIYIYIVREMYLDQLYALGVSWLNLYCKRWEMMRRDVALDFQASNLFTELSVTDLHQGLPYKTKKEKRKTQ